ncbi:Rhodanese-like domain-containing protein 14, chloroplastic, partial [Tetrabaena socialis]
MGLVVADSNTNDKLDRWLRDDRFAGKFDQTLATPKSGTPYVVWPAVHTLLVGKGLRSVTPQEAQTLQGQGWTIVDVRLASDFEKVRAAGSLSLPIYRYVEGTSFWDNVKKAAMAVGFAMKATERDPDYGAKAKAALKKNQKVLLMCAIGGTLDTLVDLRKGVKKPIRDPERAFGRESRSLKAAYELINEGWSSSNVFWVEGGLQQWRFQGLPTEGDEE